MPAPRSPRYPNISLSEAIGRAKLIYQKEHMSTMTPPVAAEAMGYKGISGASLKTISSLKKYGLLEGRGDDVRLSKDAQTLAIDDPSSSDYRAALTRAANGPEVFVDIAKQFPGLASERNISVYLEKQGFRSDAASIVAKYYKDSLALVSGGGLIHGENEENADEQVSAAVEAPKAERVNFRPGSAPRYVADQPVALDPSAPFRITMNGTKLHVEADVDLAGLQTLKQMLNGYEAILKLLATPVAQTPRPEWADKAYKPQEGVPVGGVYSLQHFGHEGVNELEFSIGRRFPTCAGCDEDVRYTYDRPPGTPPQGSQE